MIANKMERRDFLNRIGLAGLGISLGGCSLFDSSEMPLGNVTELGEQDFWVRTFNGDDILVKRNQTGQPECFSLVCSHKQCTVKWRTQEKQFVCPCHKGRYDQNGNVLSGKPTKALTKLRIEDRNGILIVLNEKI